MATSEFWTVAASFLVRHLVRRSASGEGGSAFDDGGSLQRRWNRAAPALARFCFEPCHRFRTNYAQTTHNLAGGFPPPSRCNHLRIQRFNVFRRSGARCNNSTFQPCNHSLPIQLSKNDEPIQGTSAHVRQSAFDDGGTLAHFFAPSRNICTMSYIYRKSRKAGRSPRPFQVPEGRHDNSPG